MVGPRSLRNVEIPFFSLFEERFETCSSLDLEISLVLAKFTFEIFPGGEEGRTEGGGGDWPT